jgi:hypothetical protein
VVVVGVKVGVYRNVPGLGNKNMMMAIIKLADVVVTAVMMTILSQKSFSFSFFKKVDFFPLNLDNLRVRYPQLHAGNAKTETQMRHTANSHHPTSLSLLSSGSESSPSPSPPSSSPGAGALAMRCCRSWQRDFRS